MSKKKPGFDDDVAASTLLNTVLADTSLRERLEGMPADQKTILISGSDDATECSHPSWEQEFDTPQVSSQDETIDLTGEDEDFAERSIVEGFVPRRLVTHPEGGPRHDADYRMVGKLGSGGTAIVYQVHQRAVDREVAIKVLREELAVRPKSRGRFLAEARLIGGLDHPNVIALHELCLDAGGRLFYSMKRIDGNSWDQQIGEMSLGENLRTLRGVADAIRYAHSRGIIHRDIKPENVMLGRFGEVLVVDWGLAISRQPGEFAPQDHSIGGTPAYMAPELASGNQEDVSFHTDVYLMGAVLFQILTGHPPHFGDSLMACIRAAAANEIRPSRIEGELMEIALRAMSTAPSDRFSSADEFVQALNDQRQHEQSSRLVDRARKRVSQASAESRFEDFGVAEALLREAIELWPENRWAEEALMDMYVEFASAAVGQGNLDLAILLYEAAGLQDSEVAVRIRREREERNQNAEKVTRYSALFTQLPEAGLLGDVKTGTIVEANEKFQQMFGLVGEEIVGTQIGELRLWACEERREAFVDELVDSRNVDNFEAPMVRRNGQRIDVLISARKTTIDGEEMLVSTLRDISARKAAERELELSRERLRDVQKLARLGTWSYDVLSEEVKWSDEAFRLAGRRPDQGVPSREEYMSMIHSDDHKLMESAIQTAIRDGAAYEIRIRQKGAGNMYQQLIVRGQPIFDDDGQTVEVYGVLIPTGVREK